MSCEAEHLVEVALQAPIRFCDHADALNIVCLSANGPPVMDNKELLLACMRLETRKELVEGLYKQDLPISLQGDIAQSLQSQFS